MSDAAQQRRLDALLRAVELALPLMRSAVLRAGADPAGRNLEHARRALSRARDAFLSDTQPIDIDEGA